MNQSIELQIEECENRLKQAMLHSDVSVLDELLASDLIFTNHLGQLMTRQDDLAAHESGTVKITEITLSDQKVKIYGGVVIVSVQAHISGSFAEEKSESDFRFTRVWSKASSEAWQIVAGHSSIVV
ncbi:MAG: nuclear transport factor 2 family protein [Gammaproteobacteria bacterium]|nr:nuclear transport factor 2 family protein [Gammaproteobacteria bacterium]